MFNIAMFFTSLTLLFAVMARGPEFGFGVFVGGGVVAVLHWLWRKNQQTAGRSNAPQPRQQRTGPFKAPSQPTSKTQSSSAGDYRDRPIYKKLVTACAGDRAKADRLIAYEMTRDRNLSPATATVEALDRLQRDRAGY